MLAKAALWLTGALFLVSLVLVALDTLGTTAPLERLAPFVGPVLIASAGASGLLAGRRRRSTAPGGSSTASRLRSGSAEPAARHRSAEPPSRRPMLWRILGGLYVLAVLVIVVSMVTSHAVWDAAGVVAMIAALLLAGGFACYALVSRLRRGKR